MQRLNQESDVAQTDIPPCSPAKMRSFEENSAIIRTGADINSYDYCWLILRIRFSNGSLPTLLVPSPPSPLSASHPTPEQDLSKGAFLVPVSSCPASGWALDVRISEPWQGVRILNHSVTFSSFLNHPQSQVTFL